MEARKHPIVARHWLISTGIVVKISSAGPKGKSATMQLHFTDSTEHNKNWEQKENLEKRKQNKTNQKTRLEVHDLNTTWGG